VFVQLVHAVTVRLDDELLFRELFVLVRFFADSPKQFPSKEQASQWLAARDAAIEGTRPAGEISESPDVELSDPDEMNAYVHASKIGDSADVASDGQSWNLIVPVRHLTCYPQGVSFTGSIERFFPSKIKALPGESTLDEEIDDFFAGRSPEIVCSLGDDWNFPELEINPRVRSGLCNLVEQNGFPGTVFDFLRRLETSLKLTTPGLSAAAVADFWLSWQTGKHVADFCYELGRSKVAIAVAGNPLHAESIARRTLDLARTQIAAFAQSAADRSTHVPTTAALPEESLKVRKDSVQSNLAGEARREVPTRSLEVALFEQLSPSGKAGFKKAYTDDVYLTAHAEFASGCDDAFLQEFPTTKLCSLPRIQAGVVRLSKRLSSLAEAYFQGFASGVGEVAKQEIATKFDLELTKAWCDAVVQEYTKKLWSEIDAAWGNWLDRIRQTSDGQAFGARVRPVDDREHLTLKSHERLMTETLWRIAEFYSISDQTVDAVLRASDVSRPDPGTTAMPETEPAMEASIPVLELTVQAEIEAAREKVREPVRCFALYSLIWGNLFEAEPSLWHTIERKPATLKLQLGGYAEELFNIEAKHYGASAGSAAQLSMWLLLLAGRIEEEIIAERRRKTRMGFQFHAPESEQRAAIKEHLKNRVKALTTQDEAKAGRSDLASEKDWDSAADLPAKSEDTGSSTKANSDAVSPANSPKREVCEQPESISTKGDASVLGDMRLVNFMTAQKYLGIRERQRQNLMRSDILKVEGKGQNRKITTESLKAYLPPKNTH
jgi:hypothetical protein